MALHAQTLARDTVVVVGGGFTGIEIAAELPTRVWEILGQKARIQVIIVESAPEIGPELGSVPRPIIAQPLSELGVECRLGASVTAIDSMSITTSTGERIDTNIVIWTAGL